MGSAPGRGLRADPLLAGGIRVLPDTRSSGLTYEPFYGLREKAFSLTSDSRFFYESRSQGPAFDDLLGAIRRRDSLNVLTGDIGMGKTTLCRAIVRNLDQKTFSAFVPDPFSSREDLLRVLLVDFGVASTEDLTRGRLRDASRAELSYLLNGFLDALAPLSGCAVVFLDEAQNLSLSVLEEVRMLSDADGPLQIVLVGQLELRQKLMLPEMRQIDQRVSAYCTLAPLDCAGVAGYISHRLRIAGGSAERLTFSQDAVEAIYARSGGVPRIINRLCDRALRHGYTERATTIDAETVAAANSEAIVRTDTPSAAIAMAPAPAATVIAMPVPPASAAPGQDPLDVWLTDMDKPENAVAVIAPPKPLASAAPGQDPLDVWLTAMDEPENAVAAMLAQSGAPAEEHWPRRSPRVITDTAHLRRATTRRIRPLTIVLLCLLMVVAALGAAAVKFDLSLDQVTRAIEQFAPPADPRLPPRLSLRLAPPLELPRAADAVAANAVAATLSSLPASMR
jgi:general secretion pathway protein A